MTIRGTTHIQGFPPALNGTGAKRVCLFPVTVEVRRPLLKGCPWTGPHFKPQLESAFRPALMKIRSDHLLSEIRQGVLLFVIVFVIQFGIV